MGIQENFYSIATTRRHCYAIKTIRVQAPGKLNGKIRSSYNDAIRAKLAMAVEQWR